MIEIIKLMLKPENQATTVFLFSMSPLVIYPLGMFILVILEGIKEVILTFFKRYQEKIFIVIIKETVLKDYKKLIKNANVPLLNDHRERSLKGKKWK